MPSKINNKRCEPQRNRQQPQQQHRHITLDTGTEPQATQKLQESGLQDRIQE